MRVLLVRHGVAMERDEYQRRFGPDADDDQRPLTEQGQNKMRRNSVGFERLIRQPEIIVSSPLLRAQQTAAILNEIWPQAVYEICAAVKPDSNPEELADWFRSRSRRRPVPPHTMVIVGHEPHVSRWLSWATGVSVHAIGPLKKGGACLIDFDQGKGWMQAKKGRLRWLVTPKILKATNLSRV